MNRYISSFIISSIFYVAIIVALIYFTNLNSRCDADTKIQSVKKVCFTVITQPETPKPKPKPKKEKKIEPKPKSKPKPKPKPEPIPQPVKKEPVPEPTPEPEPIIQEQIVKEDLEPVEEVIEEVEKVAEYEEITTETQSEINHDVLLAKQNQFISDLIQRINSNKSYPNMARRRSIEGVVDVKFKVIADGNVEDIEIVSGRSIFKKSAIQAIDRSFPIIVDSSLFDFPKEFKIKISYVLK